MKCIVILALSILWTASKEGYSNQTSTKNKVCGGRGDAKKTDFFMKTATPRFDFGNDKII